MNFREFVLKYRWWLIGAIATVVVLSLAGWLYYQYSVKDLVATISGQKIYKKDINRFAYGITMSGTPENPNLENSGLESDSLLKDYIQSQILLKEAPNQGIKLDDVAVEDYIKTNFPNISPEVDYYDAIFEYQKYQYIKEELSQKITGVREGRFVIAREDVYLPDQLRETTEEDKKKISESKVYAKNFIDDIFQKLKNKTITFEEAQKRELNDPIIGDIVPSENSAIHSGSFDQEDYMNRTGILASDLVLDRLKDQKAGDFTEPIHLTKNFEGVDTDVAWVIVLTDKSNGTGGQNFDTWYDEIYTKYNVVIRSK